MVFSLFCFTLFSTNISANASELDLENNNVNLIDNLHTEIEKSLLIVSAKYSTPSTNFMNMRQS